MYTVHTTAEPETIALESGLVGVQSNDCFYGWGEERDDSDCLAHTVVEVKELRQGELLADTLIYLEEQVVITDSADWSQVITRASAPIFYKAKHQH